MIIIREVLSAWKWVLIFGSIIGFLLLSHHYILSGVSPIFTLILLPTIIVSICSAVVLHRNITLNGHISIKVGFCVALLTIISGLIMGQIFSKLLFDLPLFNIMVDSSDVPRRYYSFEKGSENIDIDELNRVHIIQKVKEFLMFSFIFSGLSLLIAKIFSK